jgi:hypothetical protein
MVKQGQYISSLECNHHSSHQIRVHLTENIDPVIEHKMQRDRDRLREKRDEYSQ